MLTDHVGNIDQSVERILMGILI